MVASKTAFLEALDTIKSKGFGFIKLELEAQLNRGYAENDCEDCYEGFNSCDNCGGDGVVGIEGEHEVECTQCGGEGQYDCNSCNGRGQSRDGASVEWCEDYILNHMGLMVSQNIVMRVTRIMLGIDPLNNLSDLELRTQRKKRATTI